LLEAANEELKRKDQLKDEFINIATHELRAPIQPILGLAELRRRKSGGAVGDSNSSSSSASKQEIEVAKARTKHVGYDKDRE
jgi:signal transduction histidine kinase